MKLENYDETETDDAPESPTGDDGADLAATLADNETTFIGTDEKPKLNRSTVVMIAITAIGGLGFYFMHLRTGPSSAAASTPTVVAAKKTINAFLDSGATNKVAMKEMFQNTQKIVQQFLQYPSVTQVPLGELKANPFQFRTSVPGESKDELAAKKKREEERALALKSVQALQLQSIMSGGARTACMINNTIYREGQQIDQLTIEKISPTSVIVKTGAYRFELTLQK